MSRTVDRGFERTKKELLGPIYLEAGAALFDCQAFEYGIAYLLYLFARRGIPVPIKRCEDILDGEEKKTAGQLIALLKSHVQMSDGIADGLVEGLAARNNLIHRYLIDNVERLVDLSESNKMVREIRALRSKVRRSRDRLDPFIQHLAHAADGLNMEHIASEAKRQFIADAAKRDGLT